MLFNQVILNSSPLQAWFLRSSRNIWSLQLLKVIDLSSFKEINGNVPWDCQNVARNDLMFCLSLGWPFHHGEFLYCGEKLPIVTYLVYNSAHYISEFHYKWGSNSHLWQYFHQSKQLWESCSNPAATVYTRKRQLIIYTTSSNKRYTHTTLSKSTWPFNLL